MSTELSSPPFSSFVDATLCGAAADGVTDDRAALQLAIASAVSLRESLRLGPGIYRISGYLDVNGARSLKIFGEGATIRFPSDDAQVAVDSVATSITMARSAILLRHCTDVSIEGITFVGGSAQNLFVNQGGAIYATHCVGTRVSNCTMIEGFSPFHQDAQTDTNGSGDSLAVAAAVVTLTDAAARFVTGHVAQLISIAGCTNPSNNGSFRIASYVDATQVTYANPNAVAETSSFRWSIADADRDTRINACRIETRGYMAVGSESVIEQCHFERPTAGNDATGIGGAFTLVGTTVTLTDWSGRFLPQHHGRYVTVASATSAANNGTYKLTYITATQISWTNVSGVAELFRGTWWIMGGDITGIGAGANGLTRSGSTVTLTAAVASFSPGDTGKLIRIKGATSARNNGVFVLTYVGPTQVAWTNTSGVSETFNQKWAIDAYDSGKDGGNTYGSTHGIYLFAGRNNVLIQACTFIGIRTTAIKVSGSLLPIRNITVIGNYARDCGAFFIGGADDSQEHTALNVSENQIVDCATGRDGWTDGAGITWLGSRNSSATMNHFHYTRNSIGSVDGRGVAGRSAIQASRYVEGNSQPVDDIAIQGNQITADPSSTTPGSILSTAIELHSVGQRTKYGTAGTLTRSASTMTLTVAGANFSRQDVGKTLTLINSENGNDGSFAIEAVASPTVLSFTNPGGTGAGAAAGTYRIPPQSSERGGACLVADNQILNVGSVGISSRFNVGTEIRGNVFSGLLSNIVCDGDVSPRVVDNREIATGTRSARLALRVGVSWPFVADNLVTNQAIASSSSRGWGVAVSGSTAVDYPLLGKRGRARPSDGKEEIVVAYGSLLVDGDTITVTGATYTYKTSAPNGSQFNSFDGLVALINAQTGYACTDYGTGFHDSAGSAADVPTQHLRIRKTTATTDTDGKGVNVQVSALNPTALVLLRNHSGANTQCEGRGSGSAGATADKTVVWSPACSAEGGVMLWADNAQAQALLQASGYRPVKHVSGQDSGCCELLTHGTSTGSEEFRWALA